MALSSLFFCGDQHTVNGLTAYKLGAASGGATVLSAPDPVQTTRYIGLKSFRRTVAGVETVLEELAYPIVFQSAYNPTTFVAPAITTMGWSDGATTDSLVIEVHLSQGAGSVAVRRFTTGQLGATSLPPQTWTFTARATGDNDEGAWFDFLHGGSEVSSIARVEAAPVTTNPATWLRVANKPSGEGIHGDFKTSDIVRAGEYVYGQSRDTSKVSFADYLVWTGDSFAARDQTNYPAWAASWGAHDKYQSFEIEGEYWVSGVTALDVAFVWYPHEATYAHVMKNNTGALVGFGAAWVASAPYVPTLIQSDRRNRWVKTRVRYEYVAGRGRIKGYEQHSDGLWSETPWVDVGLPVNFPNPTIAQMSFAFNTGVYFRNMKVIEGELSAYSFAPSRCAGWISMWAVKVGASSAWANVGSQQNRNGAVDMYNPADSATDRFVIWNGSTNAVLNFPGAFVPEDQTPTRLSFRAKHVDWKIVNEAGGTLLSGYSGSTEAVAEIDLKSLIGEPYVRPVITLKDSTSLMRWVDMSWSDPAALVPIDPTDVLVTLVGADLEVTYTSNAADATITRYKVAYDGGPYGSPVTLDPADTAFAFVPTAGWQSVKVAVCEANAFGDSQYLESNTLTSSIAHNGPAAFDASAAFAVAGTKHAHGAASFGSVAGTAATGTRRSHGAAGFAATAATSSSGSKQAHGVAAFAAIATFAGTETVIPADVPSQFFASGGSPLMRAHTVTIYNLLGEIDRHAAYSRTVLVGVRVEETSGAVASAQGRTSTDGVLVFIPGGMPGFIEPEAFAGDGWTLRDGDLLVVGDCALDIPPNSITDIEKVREVYHVTGFETLRLRGNRVHHWGVAGA